MNRFRNILIGACVLMFSLWRGGAQKRTGLKNIIIVYPTNNIGDMVCATPVFRAIKEYNPTIHVTVIGSSKNESLLTDNAYVDEYIVGTTSLWTLVNYLRKKQIDAGIVIGSSVFDFATLFFARVKTISCFTLTDKYKTLEARPYQVISRLAHCVEYFPGKYVPEQYLQLLKPLGIDVSGIEKNLGYSNEARNFVLKRFSEINFSDTQKIVVIAPGAGALFKQWPPERFAQVGNHLYKKFGIAVVVVGSVNDSDAIEKTIENFDAEVKYWNCGPQTMDVLKAVLANACLVIGNDSGAIHVGEALGTKTLTIAGATDVTEHMRSDERHIVIRPLAVVVPLYQAYIVNEATIDLGKARAQMEAVTVDEVNKGVETLICQGK